MENNSDAEIKVENGITHVTFNSRAKIDVPDGVKYYERLRDILAYFISEQKRKPYDAFLMRIDFLEITELDAPLVEEVDFDLEDEIIQRFNPDDNFANTELSRWVDGLLDGFFVTNICGEFRDRISSCTQDIFLEDSDRVMDVARKYGITLATEKGDRMLVFDDDAAAAAAFICQIATNIEDYPKDVRLRFSIKTYEDGKRIFLKNSRPQNSTFIGKILNKLFG